MLTEKDLLAVLQLMGSFVLAVGLWLRFDPETVSLLNGDEAPDTFFLGEYHTHVSWYSCGDGVAECDDTMQVKSQKVCRNAGNLNSRIIVNNRKLLLHSINPCGETSALHNRLSITLCVCVCVE